MTDFYKGQVLLVCNQGTAITPQTIKVTIQWVAPDRVHYTVEGDPKMRETSIERFTNIAKIK
jgi:hypothetical protein